MKYPVLPKKIRRELSSDESLQRYFHALDRALSEKLRRRAQMMQVHRLNEDHSIELLPIVAVPETEEGLIVVVKAGANRIMASIASKSARPSTPTSFTSAAAEDKAASNRRDTRADRHAAKTVMDHDPALPTGPSVCGYIYWHCRCDRCREAWRKYSHARLIDRRERGICPQCALPVVEGRRKCRKHLTQARDRMRRRAAARAVKSFTR